MLWFVLWVASALYLVRLYRNRGKPRALPRWMQRLNQNPVLRVINEILAVLLKLAAAGFFFFMLFWVLRPFVIMLYREMPVLLFLLVGFPFLWLAIFTLRRLFGRRRFLRALSAFAARQGCELTLSGAPYRNALFPVRAGAILRYPEREITLYFMACRRGVPVLFRPEGEAIFLHRIRLARADLFSWQHSWRFVDEPAENSFLLLLPPPNRVYLKTRQASSVADNGDRCGRYGIYGGNAFLRQMERDAVFRT